MRPKMLSFRSSIFVVDRKDIQLISGVVFQFESWMITLNALELTHQLNADVTKSRPVERVGVGTLSAVYCKDLKA
jgi:hypothetical protein